MARRRPKTRVEHLAEALSLAQRAAQCLDQVDLRSGPRDLRDAVKMAKGGVDQMIDGLGQAVVADVPMQARIPVRQG